MSSQLITFPPNSHLAYGAARAVAANAVIRATMNFMASLGAIKIIQLVTFEY